MGLANVFILGWAAFWAFALILYAVQKVIAAIRTACHVIRCVCRQIRSPRARTKAAQWYTGVR